MTTSPDLIQTPFGCDSTAAEVLEGIDLSGKRAIVTGGSSGIGIETARALASVGAEVTIAVRDTGAGDRTATDIAAATGNAVRVGHLDLADQASVATFVADWAGPRARVLRFRWQNRGIAIPGDVLTCSGTVAKAEEGVVECELEERNQKS